jgi:5-methylcytosine-specific restriction protein A
MRAVDEWIGKNDDEQIPRRVRARVFERYQGRCYLSGALIPAGSQWDIDHVVALANGGEHRESNLAPVLKDKHKEKTKADVKIKSKTARMRAKHIGLKKPRTIKSWRRFSGEIVYAGRER